MSFAKTADNYAVFHHPNISGATARINIYCEDGYKLYILFFEYNSDLSNNTQNESAKIGICTLPYSHYPQYIDLIRNEKPIRDTFRPEDTPPWYVVYASKEEIGEGEMEG